jgi:multidrug resistance efflux pump
MSGQASPFRAAALAARSQVTEERSDDVLQVLPAAGWWTFVIVSSSVLAAVVFACLTPVSITCVGRARLLEPEGTLLMRAPADAYLESSASRNGQLVATGDLLLSFRSPERQAALVRATLQRELAARTLDKRRQSHETTQKTVQGLLGGLVGASRLSYAEQRRIKKLMEERASARQSLAEAGLVPGLDAQLAELELRKETQQLFAIKGSGLTAQATLADWEIQAQRLVDDAEERLESAVADEESARSAMAQLTVRAELSGRLEGLYLKPGSFVASGTELGKLVPEGKPSRVIAFVSEADRAFLSIGTAVRIELDQLPAGEFGIVHGRVQRVGGELASMAELQAELGHDEQNNAARYRVEVEVLAPPAELGTRLRSGMLGRAHFELRERRLISFLFAPLKELFVR